MQLYKLNIIVFTLSEVTHSHYRSLFFQRFNTIVHNGSIFCVMYSILKVQLMLYRQNLVLNLIRAELDIILPIWKSLLVLSIIQNHPFKPKVVNSSRLSLLNWLTLVYCQHRYTDVHWIKCTLPTCCLCQSWLWEPGNIKELFQEIAVRSCLLR